MLIPAKVLMLVLLLDLSMQVGSVSAQVEQHGMELLVYLLVQAVKPGMVVSVFVHQDRHGMAVNV